MSDTRAAERTAAAPVGFDVARGALALLPPVTLVTALLFYFGWAKVTREAAALGASDTVFGYSTSDFLLRSVDSLYFPLMVLTAAALLALLGHQWLQHRIDAEQPEWLAPAGTVVLVVGLLIVAYGLWYRAAGYRSGNDFLDVSGPLALGLGPVVATYGAWMRARSRRGDAPTAPTWQRAVAAGLLLGIVALSLFWAVGNYAGIRGRQAADLIAAGYRTLPHVAVYSSKDLGLAPDVTVERLSGADQKYLFRYTGLHLLDRVGGTWFLMPDDWDSTHRLIMLAEDGGLRFELTG